MTAHSEQRMRVQHDVEVQIAIAAAIQSLAALARQAQPLPICCALGNACLYLMRHAMQEPVLVVFGYGKLKLDFGAVVGVLEADELRAPRLAPLAYLPIDGKTIIIGSYAGADIDPAWVHNLRADPRAHVEVGTTDYDVFARELPPAERDEMFPKITAVAPGFADYQAKTSRIIPLFELQPA